MGFGAGLELGKALPGLLAKAIIGLPVLAVAWLGKKIFSFAGKALAWLFKPLQGALKFLVGAVGLILAPIKFIFGVLSTIGGIILGVVSFALKGVFAVLGGIFKLATGIAKGVFKVVAGIFSFVPKAITWGFKTAFSMLKGIWGGVKSIWNWTKESIKSPGKIYKIAFIAGFVYGFIIKQIKKHGFKKWISNLSGGILELVQPAIEFLKDLGRNIGKWISEQWTGIIKPTIKRWWNEWEPDTEFGKFVKDGINWVIDLFSDSAGPNGKGVLGKNGPFMQWIDKITNTIKGWFFDDEHIINQLVDNFEADNKLAHLSDDGTEES
jgi:phage-related protein